MAYIIGVDVGGTFTDAVLLDANGSITLGKSLSTPYDFSVGVLESVRDAADALGLRLWWGPKELNAALLQNQTQKQSKLYRYMLDYYSLWQYHRRPKQLRGRRRR